MLTRMLPDETPEPVSARAVADQYPTPDMSRRTVMQSVAWTVPVIALAVGTPLTAASAPTPTVTCGGTPQDNGVYTVQDNILTILYRTAPDIYEVNARGTGWSKSYGTNYGTAPERGSLTWSIALPDAPTWIQVHSFNSHFGEAC